MSKEILLLLFLLLQAASITGNARLADIEEHPYHVSIRKFGRHACSGALVHESWILTAASCLQGATASALTVRVRSASLLSGGDSLEVNDIVVHEKFDKYLHHHDIALVKLRVPAEFGEKLLPIGLPERENYIPDDGTTCFVTGWKHSLVGTVSPWLTVTAAPIVSLDTCTRRMPGYKPVSARMVCAGGMSRGTETCQGDPGAPLMEGQTLIGLLSYGLGCKTTIHPGVYTRISSYLAWISASSGIRFMRDEIRGTRSVNTALTFAGEYGRGGAKLVFKPTS